MIIHFTDLILTQAKIMAVMFCAGIFVESLWQFKKAVQGRMAVYTGRRAGQQKEVEPLQTQMKGSKGFRSFRIFSELIFWATSAAALSAFLYYCSYGRISLPAVVSFLAGLLLWKKMCLYGKIKVKD